MTIKVHEKLLLTGAAGGLGKALRDRLKANCSTLRLSDVQAFGEAVNGEEIILADLADAAAVDTMVQGVEAIVHLGGMSVEGPFGPILQANILGAYNLYEAARKHGVKRVIFASSNHVTGFYRQDETITADHPARPDGMYGLSKAFGEDLSRFYFDRYGIETACVRIAAVFADAKACGKPSGILAPVEADARRYLAMGATFVGVGSDLGAFRSATQALCDRYRD
jgi:uronate dehydrogenase